MAKQSIVACGVLGAVLLLAGWWALVPKIGRATESEVRAHVAPELLQPLPHPEGGVARFDALLRAIDELPAPKNWREERVPLDLDSAVVSDVIEILRAGSIDRIRHDAEQQWVPFSWQVLYTSGLYSALTRISNGLARGALQAADTGDWARSWQHMEALGLLLDRLFESDARLQERRGTTAIEMNAYRAALALASHRDLPANSAEQLSAMLVKDRHDPASLLPVLQGEMQRLLLGRIGVQPISEYAAGTYEPLETAELLSARFLTMAREAGLSEAKRSVLTFSEAEARRSELSVYRRSGPTRPGLAERSSLRWPVRRIRLNTARNSIGRTDAAAYPDGNLMQRMLEARSLQDQAAAALAVVRFRQSAARDPKDFAELVAAGLLRAVPMNHAQERPLPFDLNALFVPHMAPRDY